MRTNVVKRSTGSAPLVVNALAVENALQQDCNRFLTRMVEYVEVYVVGKEERFDDGPVALGDRVVHGRVARLVLHVHILGSLLK